MIRIDTDTHGPIFNGMADAALEAFILDAEEEVAQEGVNIIRTELDHVLRHQTGRYRSSIQTDRAHDGMRIHDGGIIYGAWLEGVGSRNKTTRFKGYFTFRRMHAVVQAKAHEIAEMVLHKYIGRMQ